MATSAFGGRRTHFWGLLGQKKRDTGLPIELRNGAERGCANGDPDLEVKLWWSHHLRLAARSVRRPIESALSRRHITCS